MSKLEFSAEILKDSVFQDSRIVTMELTYPRIIHSEFMTHRTHSRNAASSRAIPVSKMIQNVQESPFIPMHWGANQSGMQARQELDAATQSQCRFIWMEQRQRAIDSVKQLNEIGLHKQIANRLLEPWMWITVIATANHWGWQNMFKLRCHKDAEPHFQRIAEMARGAMRESCPQKLNEGDWHLPLTGFIGDESLSIPDLVKCCIGRCARVSYLTHDGVRDTSKDIELHDSLAQNGHWSPFEHAAQAWHGLSGRGGNLGDGWLQYRKIFQLEFV